MRVFPRRPSPDPTSYLPVPLLTPLAPTSSQSPLQPFSLPHLPSRRAPATLLTLLISPLSPSLPCLPPLPLSPDSPTRSPLSPLSPLSVLSDLPSLPFFPPLPSPPFLPRLPSLPSSFPRLTPFPALSATQFDGILAAGPALVEWTLGQQPGRSAGAGRKRKRGATPAAPSLTPAALKTPPGAGRCDVDGDARPDLSSMHDVSLLQWRWRREGERVTDMWRGGGVVTREAERESGGAGNDGCNSASSIGDSGDCSESDGDGDGDGDGDSDCDDTAGSDGGAGSARDWAGVLTAGKLLNPTQVITRIAPLLSRSSSFPLPPTAAAAAATSATSPAGTPMPAGTAAATAAGALDSVDSLEARCLALRLIGCLAPLAADVAHVQELVVRAAMEAEGQQEVSELRERR
ncbi:unnamed protein product, partial [Closterium sp. Naga37s-1]